MPGDNAKGNSLKKYERNNEATSQEVQQAFHDATP